MSFIDKTWNVRGISPLAICWSINLNKTKKKRDSNDDEHSLSRWEESLTTRLRRQALPHCNNHGTTSTIRDEGTRAQLRLMEWSSENDDSQNHISADEENETKTMTHHLFVDIVVAEESCAQLALCFAQNAKHDSKSNRYDIEIEKFGFVLTRGQRIRGLMPVLDWLESTFGCSVSSQPFTYSPRQITSFLLPSLRQNSNRNNSRPLELTFEVIPKNTGLETLSLTVPPHALDQLRSAINQATTDIMIKEENNCDWTLRTLEHFLWEVFCINVRNFRLIRAANDIVVLASDGRCKFLSHSHLPNIFQRLNQMIQSSYEPTINININQYDDSDDNDNNLN